jgi:hypothetical protein
VYDDAPEFPFEDPHFGHPDEFGHDEFGHDEPVYRGDPASYQEEELDEVEGGEQLEHGFRGSPGGYRDMHEEIDDEVVDEEVIFKTMREC